MSLLDHPSLLGQEPLIAHLEFLTRQRGGDAYPPFDVLQSGENQLLIRIAVAGFTHEDLRVIAQPHQLLVIGKRQSDEGEAAGSDFFHNGIAMRAFQRRFSLGPALTVTKADVADGILEISLERPDLREAGQEISVEERTS